MNYISYYDDNFLSNSYVANGFVFPKLLLSIRKDVPVIRRTAIAGINNIYYNGATIKVVKIFFNTKNLAKLLSIRPI